MIKIIYLLQIFSCFFMTGLIWLIQLVHYPAFRFISVENYADFQRFHTTVITFIVGPIMVVELATALSLFGAEKAGWMSTINLIGVALIWLATFFLSVPAHSKLASGFDLETINTLVKTNWIRTTLWTARSGLLSVLLFERMR